MPESRSTCKRPTLTGNSTYFCDCHRRMGNDFWFMPSDRCMYEGDLRFKDAPVVSGCEVHSEHWK